MPPGPCPGPRFFLPEPAQDGAEKMSLALLPLLPRVKRRLLRSRRGRRPCLLGARVGPLPSGRQELQASGAVQVVYMNFE